LHVRKHHCRACGRVVCGNCSRHQLFLPGSTNQQRVCDPCFELHQNAKAATLTEKLSKNRQVEASLKADLKVKHSQAEWFRRFLVRIDADATDAGIVASGLESGRADIPSVVRDSISLDAVDPEVQVLVTRAQQQWRAVCGDFAAFRAETQRLQQDVERLDREGRERVVVVQALQKAVKRMETELKGRPQKEVERDHLKVKVGELQRELEGLTQRISALETNRPSTSSFSFPSFRGGSAGSASGSMIGSVANDAPGGDMACRDRCTSVVRRCTVM